MKPVHIKIVQTLFIFFMSFIATAHSSTITIEKDGDLLTKAHNIKIGGQYYSVSFMDDLAETLFKTAETPWNFTFNDMASAQNASNELLNQVFIHDDSELQYYDIWPTWTYGIPGTVGGGTIANIITPFNVIGPDLYYISAINLNGIQQDYVSDQRVYQYQGMDTTIMSSGTNEYVWAVWTPVTAPVPEPNTFALLGLGILCMAGIRRSVNQ